MICLDPGQARTDYHRPQTLNPHDSSCSTASGLFAPDPAATPIVKQAVNNPEPGVYGTIAGGYCSHIFCELATSEFFQKGFAIF